jgi:hypothetical protein
MMRSLHAAKTALININHFEEREEIVLEYRGRFLEEKFGGKMMSGIEGRIARFPWKRFCQSQPLTIVHLCATAFLHSTSMQLSVIALAALAGVACGQAVNVDIDWATTLKQLATRPSLQVVVNPLLTRASPVHDAIFDSECQWKISV